MHTTVNKETPSSDRIKLLVEVSQNKSKDDQTIITKQTEEVIRKYGDNIIQQVMVPYVVGLDSLPM